MHCRRGMQKIEGFEGTQEVREYFQQMRTSKCATVVDGSCPWARAQPWKTRGKADCDRWKLAILLAGERRFHVLHHDIAPVGWCCECPNATVFSLVYRRTPRSAQRACLTRRVVQSMHPQLVRRRHLSARDHPGIRERECAWPQNALECV